MKTKLMVAVAVVALALGAVVWAQSQDQAKPDPRIDKLLEQNEQILKGQTEILKNQAEMRDQIDKLRTLVMTIKRG